MNYLSNTMYVDSYLNHFGVLGMRWGVRRYVNRDGSLTKQGIAKYRKGQLKNPPLKYRTKRYNKEIKKLTKESTKREKKMIKAYQNMRDLELEKVRVERFIEREKRANLNKYEKLYKKNGNKYSSDTDTNRALEALFLRMNDENVSYMTAKHARW